jgi:phosphoglycerol transferase MdoB-like AlkP superfamily enzyme
MELTTGRNNSGGWGRFISQFQKDVKLWLLCVLFLEFFRLVFIFSFRRKMNGESDLLDVLAAILNGFRYDSMAATFWILIPFIMSVLCGFVDMTKTADRVRGVVGSLFVVLSTFICAVTLEYFGEFNDQFNQFLFEIYYDDTKAVFSTILAEYNAALNFLAIGVIVLLGLLLKKRWMKNGFVPDNILLSKRLPLAFRVVVALVIVISVIVGARGSAGHRPAQRHETYVTKDEFLNKAVLNPYVALKYAVVDHRKITNPRGIKSFLPNGDVLGAVKLVFSTDEEFKSLDEYMLRHAKGPANEPVRHVFVIVMESYDTWPMLEKYASLGLMEQLKKIATDGFYIESFLPASYGTMTSFASIITGLPYPGLHINYQKSAKEAYPFSVAETFRRLGYRTRFFYGGYLSWQRVDGFMKAQGVDETYGAPHMGRWVSANEWGVDDEELFDFVLKTVRDDVPSFNIIMSTTYHPPYDIDVYEKGFTLREVPDDIKPMYDNDAVNLNMLGHLWYSDQALGGFVKEAEKMLRFPLFAITGDHSGRKFINSKPDFFESSAVPLVLYGKDVLKGIELPEGVAGSHMDIAPTLVELAAPKSFVYYSMGKNLLETRERFLGIAANKVIGKDFITNMSKFYDIPGKSLPEKFPDLGHLKRLQKSMRGIAWWRVMKGSAIEFKNQNEKDKIADES